MQAPAPITAGPRTTERVSVAPASSDDAALDPGLLVDLALELGLQLLQHEAVGLEHVGELAGVLPPAAHDLGLDLVAVVDQRLDRLGDLVARRARRARGRGRRRRSPA